MLVEEPFQGRLSKHFGFRVPARGVETELEKKLIVKLVDGLCKLTEYHAQMEFRKAAAETRSLWALGNEYLHQAAPWKSPQLIAQQTTEYPWQP